MPLKIVKEKSGDKVVTRVVHVPAPPVKIGSQVPPRPRMEHEIDYDMHKVQRALVPVQTRCRPVTSKAA